MGVGIKYDEAWGEKLVKIYSTPDVVQQRKIIISSLDIQSDDRVLDIGSGPGLLIEDLSGIIGSKGGIHGVDVSNAMIALSKKRCSHLPQVEFKSGDATALPYDDDMFDVAISTQVYEYIEDIDSCIQELHRVIKPGGKGLVLCTDWDTLIWNTDNQERMKRILTIFEAHCADPRLPRKIAPKLKNAGFNITKYDAYTMINPKYEEATYSYGVMDFIASYLSGNSDITEEEIEEWASELRGKGNTGDYFFSISRYIFSIQK